MGFLMPRLLMDSQVISDLSMQSLFLYYLSHFERKSVGGVFDQAGCLKLCILSIKGIVLFSKNKGADQLCSYCTAAPCLCFSIGR